MLYYVSGPVTVLEPGLAVIDCGGVGYGCRITAYTAGQLKLNQQARLYITESIREDAFDLYGFISREEQRCYELLTSVNGVGPKAAMAILSSGGPQNFTLAVMTGDEKMLTAAQGIGKKIAQRIILELKDKLGGIAVDLDISEPAAATAPVSSDNATALARAALQEQGYTTTEINAALKNIDPKATTEETICYALAHATLQSQGYSTAEINAALKGVNPKATTKEMVRYALAHAALQELGYSPAEIHAALKGVDASATTEEMIRFALRAMVMKG